MFSILKRKTLLCTEQELREEKKTNSRCNKCKLQFSLEDYHSLIERKQSPDTWQNEACEILTLTEKDMSSVSEFGSRDFFYTQSVLEHSLWQWDLQGTDKSREDGFAFCQKECMYIVWYDNAGWLSSLWAETDELKEVESRRVSVVEGEICQSGDAKANSEPVRVQEDDTQWMWQTKGRSGS